MENEFRKAEGQLDLFDDEEAAREWKAQNRRFWIMLVILIAAGLATFFVPAVAHSEEPEGQGYWGVGHGRYHQQYQQMHNQVGTHCCSDGDCSPTQGRSMADGSFEVMVNGRWTKVGASRQVIDAYGLDENWHVCFDRYSLYVFCVIPANNGY